MLFLMKTGGKGGRVVDSEREDDNEGFSDK